MRNLIGVGILLALALLVVVPVEGVRDFSVQSDTEGVALIPNQQIKVALNISNDLGETELFRVSIPDVIWTVQSDPLQDYFGGIEVDDEETETLTLLISTAEELPTGPYQIEYNIVATKSNIERNRHFFINVRNDRALLRDYLATVPHLVEVPSVINPGEETNITFHLENKGIDDIETLSINLKSESIDEEVNTSLEALSKKTVQVPVIIPSDTTAKQEILNIFLQWTTKH